MTGLSPLFGVLLLLGGAVFILAGLALVAMASRPRTVRIDAEPGAERIDLHELLEPRTTAIPQILPATRPPGDLFAPYDGPLTPEPGATEEHPGERS